MNCYIHSAVAISAQNTFDAEDFLSAIITHDSKTIKAVAPNYKDFISPSASRRMATGVKMGVTSAGRALYLANLEQPDAIITGTGMGCLEDTEKFLNSIIDNDEAFLTPTAFIQSTHNTVGAQIALGLKCHGYNNTYVHASAAFESALLDAQLLLNENDANSVLVGGIDELGKEFVHYLQQIEDNKNGGVKVPFGEGASFFVLSNEAKPNAIQFQDVRMISSASTETLNTNLISFLKDNNLEPDDIDAVVLGNNGDAFDSYYHSVASSVFAKASHVHYKHLIGEYYTASAFGFWIANHILQSQHIPSEIVMNEIQREELSNVLVYNQYKGMDHCCTLLKR